MLSILSSFLQVLWETKVVSEFRSGCWASYRFVKLFLKRGQKIRISSAGAEVLINVKADENVCSNVIAIFGKQDETFSLGMHNKVKIKKV